MVVGLLVALEVTALIAVYRCKLAVTMILVGALVVAMAAFVPASVECLPSVVGCCQNNPQNNGGWWLLSFGVGW